MFFHLLNLSHTYGHYYEKKHICKIIIIKNHFNFWSIEIIKK